MSKIAIGFWFDWTDCWFDYIECLAINAHVIDKKKCG